MSTRIIPFFKYQGTGNDFVIVDLFNNPHMDILSSNEIMKICDRRFGIGADGLMYLKPDDVYDFKMVYYNADGNESTMCGNGGRCIVHLAFSLGIIDDSCRFLAVDGPHDARLEDGLIRLKMADVHSIEKDASVTLLDTGSPHYVTEVEGIDDYDVFVAGNTIRNSPKFKKDGINVNFIEKSDGEISIRTYERGVEAETLSCGTGNVAAAIAYHSNYGANIEQQLLKLKNPGGSLSVSFDYVNGSYTNIWLIGPAKMTFKGLYPLDILTQSGRVVTQ